MKLSGKLSAIGSLSGSISGGGSLSGKLTLPENIPLEPYTGPYVITPLVENATVLNTKDKHVLNDITVLEIPYSETSNLADGLTVYIGKDVFENG